MHIFINMINSADKVKNYFFLNISIIRENY
jgi:hypothetical protein